MFSTIKITVSRETITNIVFFYNKYDRKSENVSRETLKIALYGWQSEKNLTFDLK